LPEILGKKNLVQSLILPATGQFNPVRNRKNDQKVRNIYKKWEILKNMLDKVINYNQ